MAEETNGESQPSVKTKISDLFSKELSMEMRLLLAFGLMGLVLFATQYLMPKTPAPKQPAAAPAQQAAAAPPQKAPETPSAPAPAKPAPSAENEATLAQTKAADREQTIIVETDVYRIVFSNRGASLRSWVLKKYKDSLGKPVDLVSASVAPKVGWPFSYIFPKEKPAVDLNGVLFAVTQSDKYSVEFEYSNSGTVAKKSFHFDPKSYKGLYSSEVASSGKGVPHQMAWRGGFGDRSVHNAADVQKSVHYDAAKSKLVEEGSGAASKGPLTVAGPFHFAGLEDTYFAGVILPEPGSTIELTTWQDKVSPLPGAEEKEHVGVSFGGQASNAAVLFVGPKDTDVLRATDPKLETMIDWGWFWFIAKPLFLALHWVNDNLTSNWGWAIVFATVIINLLMLPMRFSQLRSSQKMAKLQPELQAIQARYKNIPMKDPRKQKQNEEMMALYQKHGINPVGGCVPLLLQMPFFIAFFKVLSVSIELRGATWLWVTDLSQPEMLAIRILPVGMLVTQIFMQKMTPAASPDPSQQRLMMIMMPIMLTVMFYGASSGLVLYWLTGNVVGIAQQYFFNKAAAKPASAQVIIPKKK
jgi:YidC/Oxa1 family membrane protein insertase